MTLTAQAFAYASDLVRHEAAIVLGPGKEYLVEARLLPLARAAGATDVSSYVLGLQAKGTPTQRMAVVEALTTNETSWFRDGEPFEVLRTTVVPELLANGSGRIDIWSAACSSGQEAYTIAMVMAEHAQGRKVDILASDLSTEMLQRTKEGSYSQLEVGRGLPAPLMVKHFRRQGTKWQVSDQLRAMVRTQRINLATPLPPLPVFDVVFLRNVLIYFDTATKKAILQRVRQVLSPQGFLFLGGAESTLGIDDSWERTTMGRFTLYRPQGGGRRAAPAERPVLTPPRPLITADRARPGAFDNRFTTTPTSPLRWATAAESR